MQQIEVPSLYKMYDRSSFSQPWKAGEEAEETDGLGSVGCFSRSRRRDKYDYWIGVGKNRIVHGDHRTDMISVEGKE